MPVAPTLILTPSQLGQVLKAARQARKLSQAALASRLGLSQSRVSHLEAHAEELSMAQLLAWSAVLGLEWSVGARAASGTAPDPTATATADW